MVKKAQTKAGLIKEMDLSILKLYNQAFKSVPNSPKQKKITEQIDAFIKLRDKLKNNK